MPDLLPFGYEVTFLDRGNAASAWIVLRNGHVVGSSPEYPEALDIARHDDTLNRKGTK